MNNDLISRSALLEAMPKNDEIFSSEVRRVICNVPAVDAVEVVRCGKCMFGLKVDESDRRRWPVLEGALQCGLIGHIVLPDNYCGGGVNADAEAQNVD